MSDRQMYIAGVVGVGIAMIVIGTYLVIATLVNRPNPAHSQSQNRGPLLITPVATAAPSSR